MADISARTLIVAIEAVNEKISTWTEMMGSVDDEQVTGKQLADEEDYLLVLSLAATELRKAYETIQQASGNLPPYSELRQAD